MDEQKRKAELKMCIGFLMLGLLAVIILMTSGCMMSKPKESDLPQTMSNMEKRDLLKYLNCMYAQQFIKTIDMKCGEMQNQMSKNSMIIDYNELSKDGRLPKIYNQKGENEMTFDDYFKFVK